MNLEPFNDNYRTDPSRTWEGLLTGPPVVYAKDLGLWVITRYDDVRRALTDADQFLNAATLSPVFALCPAALEVLVALDTPVTTAAADAPVHQRTRQALWSAFPHRPDQVETECGEIISRRVDEAVAHLRRRWSETREVDLVREFCSELSLWVALDVVGFPARDEARIRRWADGQIELVWGNPAPADQVRLARGLYEFWQYCRTLPRSAGHPDVPATAFVNRVRPLINNGDGVTEAEAASLAFNLVVAGHETTAGLLGHCLDHALSQRGRWNSLSTAGPDSVAAFVEETLRFQPPIDGWLRLTSRDVVVRGVSIPAGARCLLLIGAANRDQAAFAEPNLFRPGRRDSGTHLSFGRGPHYCVGAALARAVARAALQRLVDEYPSLELLPGFQRRFRPNVAFRAHDQLPARVAAPTTPEPAQIAYAGPPAAPDPADTSDRLSITTPWRRPLM